MFRLANYRFGIARFLLGLYVAVLVNGVVFRHAHRLADGTIICHAHPYKSSPGTQFPKHAHSRDELIWLDGFTNAFYTNPAVIGLVFLAVICFLTRVGAEPFRTVRFQSGHTAFQHRGPPCV
ncbi:hypothetical protein IC229_09800 [Spirosoma sp. BT702]|uniref:Uncharacterized protein n=1 Tax=Spirosoma profusum TaxID=2771354 RepID=A0A927AQQ3_9BACT|nr:hypothetical protein [Spirosoma profusum]MBD2700931.1 hypothetical protein [Spirosoma profusum]